MLETCLSSQRLAKVSDSHSDRSATYASLTAEICRSDCSRWFAEDWRRHRVSNSSHCVDRRRVRQEHGADWRIQRSVASSSRHRSYLRLITSGRSVITAQQGNQSTWQGNQSTRCRRDVSDVGVEIYYLFGVYVITAAEKSDNQILVSKIQHCTPRITLCLDKEIDCWCDHALYQYIHWSRCPNHQVTCY